MRPVGKVDTSSIVKMAATRARKIDKMIGERRGKERSIIDENTRARISREWR